MQKRLLLTVPVLLLAIVLVGCHKGKVQNPIANVDSKQPDKVLFDRAMQALAQHKHDVARMTLQTMINTYPDSEYVARAKLAIGDSWYDEGGAAGFAQAEIEYKDFITFFPNMPEAAEAQLKVANIHYRQMEKADRDFTHAKRAEEEYKQLLLQFPDSKLVPEAKQRLMEVQEVLAEREFRIGRFYYLRPNYSAAIARLKSLSDAYPLYSGAEEALYILGQIYEQEANAARSNLKAPEAAKGAVIQDFEKKAQDAYSRIITRYPVTPRAQDARKRLEALHLTVPTPTEAAIAQNKAEEESRQQLGRFGRLMMNLHRQPDVSQAAKVGEPTLVEPKQTGAPEVNRDITALFSGSHGNASSHDLSVSTDSTATPGPNQPAPRSDAGNVAEPPLPAPPQLNQAAPAPSQVNDAASGKDSATTGASDSAAADSSKSDSSKDSKESGKTESSSKKKGKKGLRKLIPF
ncbi:MAG TPA: outer membrane protein assembly factor BamD [Terriglobales bacterium]|nr:outer membrane protein assembly factor BamD [Terriglobales bacterium]